MTVVSSTPPSVRLFPLRPPPPPTKARTRSEMKPTEAMTQQSSERDRAAVAGRNGDGPGRGARPRGPSAPAHDAELSQHPGRRGGRDGDALRSGGTAAATGDGGNRSPSQRRPRFHRHRPDGGAARGTGSDPRAFLSCTDRPRRPTCAARGASSRPCWPRSRRSTGLVTSWRRRAPGFTPPHPLGFALPNDPSNIEMRAFAAAAEAGATVFLSG